MIPTFAKLILSQRYEIILTNLKEVVIALTKMDKLDSLTLVFDFHQILDNNLLDSLLYNPI